MAACTAPEELVGFGALLQYYNDLTSAWVTVGGTTDLEFPNNMTEEVETTSNDTVGGYKTFIPSLLAELEDVTYTLRFRWAQYKILANLKDNRAINEWRIVLMNDQQTYMKFCAFVNGLSTAIPMEELVEYDLTLRPTGSPDLGELV